MNENTILIKYVGKADCFQAEYNGQKYSFIKNGAAIRIPTEVFAYIMSLGHVDSGSIVPVNDIMIGSAEVDQLKETIAQQEKTIAALQSEIEDLKKKNKKK